MRFLPILAVGTVTSTSVLAATIPSVKRGTNTGKFLVEFEHGKSEWVTESDKWELRRNGKQFVDITNEHAEGFTPQISVPQASSKMAANKFPSTMKQSKAVKAVIADLSKENMERDLTTFSEFHTRYYKSDTGVESATWMEKQVQAAIDEAGVEGAKVERVEHEFAQFSLVATIPGQSEEVVVVGAHQDSINLQDPENGRSPGADDNGSGSVTILEAFRGLLKDENVSQGKSPLTIEFHWYAGEEAGLLGSQDIFAKYRQDGKKVKGMLNQDMTGYIKGMLDAGIEESFGLITDNSDEALVTFLEGIITEYCSIPAIKTTCGYACSDHASASRNGYPAAMVFEAPMDNSHPDIHSEGDVIEEVSFDHMLEHAKLVVGFTLELANSSE